MMDITSNRHRGNRESIAANASIKLKDKATLRGVVLDYLWRIGKGGATTEEVANALGIRYTTASARMTELKAEGRITPAGRRPTSSGRMATAFAWWNA